MIVAGIAALIFFFALCYWCLHHHDTKKEMSWRQKHLHDRMREIEKSNGNMRQSLKVPRNGFNELRDDIKLNPDFA
jgi:hypothetical protein